MRTPCGWGQAVGPACLPGCSSCLLFSLLPIGPAMRFPGGWSMQSLHVWVSHVGELGEMGEMEAIRLDRSPAEPSTVGLWPIKTPKTISSTHRELQLRGHCGDTDMRAKDTHDTKTGRTARRWTSCFGNSIHPRSTHTPRCRATWSPNTMLTRLSRLLVSLHRCVADKKTPIQEISPFLIAQPAKRTHSYLSYPCISVPPTGHCVELSCTAEVSLGHRESRSPLFPPGLDAPL